MSMAKHLANVPLPIISKFLHALVGFTESQGSLRTLGIAGSGACSHA